MKLKLKGRSQRSLAHGSVEKPRTSDPGPNGVRQGENEIVHTHTRNILAIMFPRAQKRITRSLRRDTNLRQAFHSKKGVISVQCSGNITLNDNGW